MIVSAHRGYPRHLRTGADYIEIDLRRTPDGTIVIAHDPLEPGREYPTFDEALANVPADVGLHLDLKEPGYEADIVHATRAKHGDRFVITSDDGIVRGVKELFPDVQAGLSLGDELANAPVWVKLKVRLSEAFPEARVKGTHADFVAVHWQLADFNVLRYCAKHGLPAWVWTVDEEKQLKRFLSDQRVTAVITNRPELALRLRTARSEDPADSRTLQRPASSEG